MALKVKAVNSLYPDGTEIAFGRYFLAKIGEEVVVTDEEIALYLNDTGNDLKDNLPKDWTHSQATKADVEKAHPEVEEVSVVTDEAKEVTP